MIKREWVIKTLSLLCLLTAAAIWSLPGDKLRVVICDVGQGDAILITYKLNQILVDGGPDKRVLGCLEKHMPFFDRKIEAVVLTHPQADHMAGLPEVLAQYQVELFMTGPEANTSQGYQKLLELLKTANVRNIYAGDKFTINNLQFTTVWPTREFALSHLSNLSDLSNLKVLGAATDGTDLNSFAIVTQLSYGNFDMLLTGDADARIQPEQLQTGLLQPVEVLKVPHHGSKTGMSPEWLDQIKPQMAVISAGAKNRYGHPTQQALDLLSSRGIKILRTDTDGEVEITTDGTKWWVKTSRK